MDWIDPVLYRTLRGRLNAKPPKQPNYSQMITKLLKARSDDVPRLIDKAFELALGGDVEMLKWVLNRFWAPLKPIDQTVNFDMPPLDHQISSLSDLARVLMRAVASGQLSPDNADKIGRLVAVMNQLHTPMGLQDLNARLATLEKERSLNLQPNNDIESPAIESPAIESPAIESPCLITNGKAP